MGTETPEPEPIGFRYQYVWAALTAVGTLALVFLGFQALRETDEHSQRTTTTSQPMSEVTTVAPTASPSAASPAASTLPGPRLGRNILPVSSEPCRAPNIASGSAWQVVGVSLGGESYETAYSCNLFAGGSGSLDFDLAKSYRQLEVSIGFADGQGATGHRVRFELIGNDQEYLTDPRTLRFGEEVRLVVDTVGVSRLRMEISELSPAGGSGEPSRPVLADLRLTPA